MKTDAKAHALAAAYRRLFLSDDGRVVLADLTAKFGGHRPRNPELLRYIADPDPSRPVPRACGVLATLIDGQASVILEITNAIEAGRYSADSNPNTPCQP